MIALATPVVSGRARGDGVARSRRFFSQRAITFRSLFARHFLGLVYPMPAPGGLGVHLALDLAGQARFGPDVEWAETIDYDVDPRRAESLYAAIRTYWSDLPDGALQPGYTKGSAG